MIVKLLFAVAAALVGSLLPPTPAASAADRIDANLWESPRRVCVEGNPHVLKSWGVRRVVRYWNRRTPARMTVRRDCARRWDRVTVRQVRRNGVSWSGTETPLYRSEDGVRIMSRVVLNVAKMPRSKYRHLTRCYRRVVAAHELGHSLGLEHQHDRPVSVMSYSMQRWDRCGRPARFDKRLVRRAY